MSLLCLAWSTVRDEQPAPAASADEAHAALLERQPFPSASECGQCHPRQYREWSVSPHAYAKISPVYNAFQSTLGYLTGGTLGDFCARCHTQVGMTWRERPTAPASERSEISLEGITCVVCHRVGEAYGKNAGRFSLEPGDIFAPIYGPHTGAELERVLASPDEYKRVVTEPGKPGRKVHTEARELPQIGRSAFCGRCHDIRLWDGFRVEDAFSEFKQTDAARRGETCQDCHMGPVPGKPSQYPPAPAALIGGKPTRPTRRTNHMFPGPDDPVVHPGIFPHNPEAKEFATPDEWAAFDIAAGWGTDAFEDTEPDDGLFPERWSSPDDRYDARDILDEQLALLAEAHERATIQYRNAFELGELLALPTDSGLAFEVALANATDGHSVPTGLIAERMTFLQVEVTNADGDVIFSSGDLDPNGDVRDAQSAYVHAGKLPRDEQLFNLRSPFLVRGVHGSEREQVLPANYSFEPLIFIRPSPTPSMLMGGVPNVRMQKRNIEVGGERVARYVVPAEQLIGPAPFTARARLVVGAKPPHLIRTISVLGFDYGLSARDVAETVLSRYRVLAERRLVFETPALLAEEG